MAIVPHLGSLSVLQCAAGVVVNVPIVAALFVPLKK